MKAKYLVLIGFELFFCNLIYSQRIIDQLKQFNKNADMDCYLAKIQKNVNNYFVLDNNIWGRDKYGIPPSKIVLHKDKVVPMLTIQFVNTDSFNYKDDIYNYITIDSSIVFTFACVDKGKNVFAFANFYDGVQGYLEIDKEPHYQNFLKKRDIKNVIKNINKLNPELILYSNALCGFQDDNGFMFVKNRKIFVYRVSEKDVYELNDYLGKFFSLDRIRRLNNAFVPIIYQNDQSTRRTGHTPENEKIICP